MRKLNLYLLISCLFMLFININVGAQDTYYAAFYKKAVFNKKTPVFSPISNLYFKCRESLNTDGGNDVYLTSKFTEGTLLTNDDQLFKVNIRYRVLNDEMQILFKNKEHAVHPYTVQEIMINGQKFNYNNYHTKDNIAESFFEVLCDGQSQLLKKYNCKEPKVKTSTTQLQEPYKIKAAFYIKKPNEPANLLKLNKRNLLNHMEDHKKQIRKFISKNHLSVKKSVDLIKIFKYYNTL